MTIRWNRAGEDGDRRSRRRVDRAQAGQLEQVDRPRVPHQLPGARARHGAAAADERRTTSCSSTSRRSTGSRTRRRCRSRYPSGFAGDLFEQTRLLPDARLGRGDLAAQRSCAWTSRRSWTICIAPSTIARRSSSTGSTARRLGPARRRDRVDRPRPAHDVAADRSEAPDVRRGAGREVRRRDRERLPARRRLHRRGHGARRPRHADPRRLGPRLSLVAESRQPEHLAGPERLHDAAGPAAGREEARRPVRRRHVLGERRLDADARLRHGHRPDLLQPARPRITRHRQPRRRSAPAGRRAHRRSC